MEAKSARPTFGESERTHTRVAVLGPLRQDWGDLATDAAIP